VAELSTRLNEHFRQEAEGARTEAQQARAVAERNRATKFPGYAEGGRIEREAAALFQRGEFTSAGLKYIESRNAFERARQQAEVALRTPPPAPTPAPRVAAAATPVAVAPTATPRAATPSPTALPVAPPTTTLPPPAAPTAPPTATPTAAANTNAAVLEVVQKYRQSFETKDISLFRSIYPGLSSDEEKKTRTAFEQIKQWQMDLSNFAVDVQGDRATVSTSRLDTINGNQMKPREWVFNLVRQGGQWRIESMGTGK